VYGLRGQNSKNKTKPGWRTATHEIQIKCTDNVQKPFICVADQGSQDDAIAMCKKIVFAIAVVIIMGRTTAIEI